MPSHLHLIISTNDKPMEGILRDFKSFTSRKLKEAIRNNPQESRREWVLWMMQRAGTNNSNNKNWQLWQQHNQPIELSTNEMVDQRLNYLHQNPVTAGFVDQPEYWKHSSAAAYCGKKGPLGICLIK